MAKEPEVDKRVRFYQDQADSGSLISADYNQKVLDELYAGLSPTDVRRICDVGCGMGKNLPLLRRRFPQATIVALDLNSMAARAASGAASDVLVAQGNCTALPLPGGAADLAVCTEVLEHVSDLSAAVAEIARVTRSGGFCVVSSPNYLNPIGLRKWNEDRRRGSEFWDPWGGHEGYERLMTPGLVNSTVRKYFKILRVRGAGFIMAWIPLGYGRIGTRHDRYPMIGLGRFPILRNLAMNRYLLLRKC
jgi:SAM-dependent methyltransferase